MSTDKKISELLNSTTLTGAELVPIVQDGATVKTDINTILDNVPLASATQDGIISSSDFNKLSNLNIITETQGIANNDNDETIPTSAAVKDYVDATVGGSGEDYALKYSGVTGTISVTGSYVYSDLDLSATVGSNRALAILELQGSSQGVNMFFRTKGSSMKPRDANSYAGWGASGGLLGGSNDGFIATVITNAEGVVEYTARSAVTGISYTVQAYQKLA